MYSKIITHFSKICTKQMNVLCGQNVKFFNFQKKKKLVVPRVKYSMLIETFQRFCRLKYSMLIQTFQQFCR